MWASQIRSFQVPNKLLLLPEQDQSFRSLFANQVHKFLYTFIIFLFRHLPHFQRSIPTVDPKRHHLPAVEDLQRAQKPREQDFDFGLDPRVAVGEAGKLGGG